MFRVYRRATNTCFDYKNDKLVSDVDLIQDFNLISPGNLISSARVALFFRILKKTPLCLSMLLKHMVNSEVGWIAALKLDIKVLSCAHPEFCSDSVPRFIESVNLMGVKKASYVVRKHYFLRLPT